MPNLSYKPQFLQGLVLEWYWGAFHGIFSTELDWICSRSRLFSCASCSHRSPCRRKGIIHGERFEQSRLDRPTYSSKSLEQSYISLSTLWWSLGGVTGSYNVILWSGLVATWLIGGAGHYGEYCLVSRSCCCGMPFDTPLINGVSSWSLWGSSWPASGFGPRCLSFIFS